MTTVTTTPLQFADEVVTHAFVRYLSLPNFTGEFALITLDNGLDHKRPNTLGPAGLASLEKALDEISQRAGVRAVGIVGKPYIFGAGADLSGVSYLKNHDDALAILRLGHRVYKKLRDFPVPTFAFLNGLTLGGALELALHADYRTVSGAAAGIALPEVFLGLAPGWGGSWLLPNLIGIEGALQVVIENPLKQNRMLKPPQAFELGMADALFEPADFLEQSLAWAAAVINGEITVERKPVQHGEPWDFALLIARKLVTERLHGAAPAPQVALDLLALANTASYEEAMLAEDELVSQLLIGPELKASLYAFDLVQKRARKPAGAPDSALARPVTKVGIVGAGLMASQLALLAARRLRVPVVMTDVDGGRLEKGVAYVNAEAAKLVKKGRLSADAAARIRASVTGSLTKDEFADADLVIEAVFEELGVKQQVFREIETIVRPDCVLATNTSSLSVSEIARILQHPERVVGLHFFNPVALMPLLEVIRGEATDEATLATGFAVGKQLKKSCVLVKDAPGFVVNRLLMRTLGEVMVAIDAGADPIKANESLDSLGLPMRPLELLELVGPAVALHVANTLHTAFPERFPISSTLQKTVELEKSTLLVRKSGEPMLDPEIAAALGERPADGLDGEQIRDQSLRALAEEVQLMLREGIVAGPEDIDLCMILGAGWPFHLGGITPYLRHAGYLNS